MSRIAELEKQLKEEKAKECYVCFFSPGTFMSESTSKKCEFGDIKKALKIMKQVKERYNATPYGFRFEDGNSKPISNGMYYVTGTVIKYCDVPKTKDNEILRSNMFYNGRATIIENNNSWKFTTFFDEDDIVIDFDGNIIRSGKDKDLVAYAKLFNKERDEFYKIN